MSGENFKKSDPSNDETQHTETVIIPNLPFNKIGNRLQYDAKSFKRLNKNIAVEIEKRPNMQLAQIVELNGDRDSLGNSESIPKGILLLFVKRDDSVEAIQRSITDIQLNIHRIMEKLGSL